MNFKKTFQFALIVALLITLALPAVMGGMSSQAGQNLPTYTVTIHSFQMSAVDLGPAYAFNTGLNGMGCGFAGKSGHYVCPDVSWNS